jgi:tRNA(Leu) C34 or U34 (ribose-2'-O)-methylase TrmL
MMTDRYQHVRHHDDVGELLVWARRHDLPVVAVDNTPSSKPLESFELPERVVLLFGQEGPGLSDEAVAGATATYSIAIRLARSTLRSPPACHARLDSGPCRAAAEHSISAAPSRQMPT